MIENKENLNPYNILSILAFVFSFVFFPVGFILGIISLSQIKKTNERGLGLAIASIVISTFFIFFFIIFAATLIGIIGFIFNGDKLNLNEKCFDVEIVASEVTKTMPEVFDVTLLRTEYSNEYIVIDGVKLIFSNGTDFYTYDFPGNVFQETIRVGIPEEKLQNPSEISVMVYFLDEEGNQDICPNANSISF